MIEMREGDMPESDRFYFPRWSNYLFPALLIFGIGVLTYLPLVLTLGLSPDTRAVGYEPAQPIPFSHAVHAGKLSIDCRYCHTTVEAAAMAAIPPTQTCLNCHASIKADAPSIKPLRNSFEQGTPISWIKVHDLPDFVYFNHSAHVNKGVACQTCHGQVNEMEVVRQTEPLSMAWCLECHRNPAPHLRPREQVTNMFWDASRETGKPQIELGAELFEEYHVQGSEFMTGCTTCHR